MVHCNQKSSYDTVVKQGSEPTLNTTSKAYSAMCHSGSSMVLYCLYHYMELENLSNDCLDDIFWTVLFLYDDCIYAFKELK